MFPKVKVTWLRVPPLAFAVVVTGVPFCTFNPPGPPLESVMATRFTKANRGSIVSVITTPGVSPSGIAAVTL